MPSASTPSRVEAEGSFYKSRKSRDWLKTINPDFVGT